MKLISCHDGRLLTLSEAQEFTGGPTFRTGLKAWDDLAPGGAFAGGAIHELLSKRENGNPLLAATVLARAASGIIVWSDPSRELYPPALAHHGISIQRLYLLRCSAAQQCWAMTECLRCKGVGAVVAAIERLTRVQARRLQLAAERGGGTGILLRPADSGAKIYAAATRWLVRPAPGERTVHRWNVQLLHGPGGRVGQAVTIEYHREEKWVRAIESSQEQARKEVAMAS